MPACTGSEIPVTPNPRASVFSRRSAWWLCLLLVSWLSLSVLPVRADALPLTEVAAGSLGTRLAWLQEEDAPLSLEQARAELAAGRFQHGQRDVLNFGIGAPPVWLHLALRNLDAQAQRRYLLAGATWTDRLDVYLVQAGQVQHHWRTGDESERANGLIAALGYGFELTLAPGQSELWLRVASDDPMVIPVELLTPEELLSRQRFMAYFHGFIYGFLAALCAYNFLLYTGLGERSYLYYSLYLVSLIAMNAGYTGHGLAWLWPGQPGLERYAILVLMLMFCICGLLFASRFLGLREYAPRTLRMVQGSGAVGVAAMLLCLLLDSQVGAAYVAFAFSAYFALVMVVMGVQSIHRRRAAGAYFLSAALCGALGMASTLLAVWGWIPYTALTYHGVELGVTLEATLLALALSYRIRSQQKLAVQAEQLARLDPLTGLNNRRAFLEQAGANWGAIERRDRPLSLILLDIDRFKQINDEHGHETGDRALVEIARMLTQQSRTGDVLARWGGEEFILALPETDLAHASVLAERIRQGIAGIDLAGATGPIMLTASLGVAQRHTAWSMKELIRAADMQLYEAKGQGRNRVSVAT